MFNLDKLEPDTNLLTKSLKLLDDSGIPIVFDPVSIPHEEKLFMQFDLNFKTQKTDPAISKPATIPRKFGWDKYWNSSVCSYTLNDTCERATLESDDTSMSVLISNKTLKKGTGIYKFRINFIGRGYCFAGIVYPRDIANENNARNFGSNFRLVPSFGDSFVNDIEVRFVVNMDEMEVKINEKRVVLVQDEIYIGVSMKQRGSVATLYFD